MVSKLSVRLIAAASSLALMAGAGASPARAKSATASDADRLEAFESGALIQRFLAAGGAENPSAAKFSTEVLMAELPAEDLPRLADLTRDLRRADLPEPVVNAAVDGMVDGVNRQTGQAISADEAAAYLGQINDAKSSDVQVADAGTVAVNPRSGQVAAVDLSIVGTTDIVERQARGIIEQDIRDLEIKDDVFFSEVVETGPDSALRITLLDETKLTLGPSSRVVLDEFVYDPETKDGRLSMRLLDGVFRFASGLMPKSNYSIGTPVGDIGIRGTKLDISIICQTVDDCEATINVTEGGASLTQEGESESEATNIDEGQQLEATSDPNEDPEVSEIADNPPITEFIEVQVTLINAATELVNGQLPPGGIGAANLEAILQAVREVLQANPEIGDLIIESVGVTNPDFIDDILAEVSAQLPDQAEQLAQVASNIENNEDLLGFFDSEGENEGNNFQPNNIEDPAGNESEDTPPPYSGGQQPN